MPETFSEAKLAKERAKQLGVPFVDLTGRTIAVEVLKEITEEAVTFYQIVPIEKKDGILEVGMVNPDDLKSQEAVNFIAQSRKAIPKIFLITATDFKNILTQYRTLKEEVETALGELEKELSSRERGERKDITEAEQVIERVMAEAPITKIVAVILRHALEGRASDIHIEPMEERVKVRFRVDGSLYTGLILPKAIQAAVVSRIKILSSLKIDETRVPQDGRFHSVIDNHKIDFRVSTFPTAFGEKVVLRLLDPTIAMQDFEKLGIIGRNSRVIKEAIEKPFGMILLTGPTGSGKTTALYAILRELNDDEVNIVSLEDPVEYHIEGVSQSQVKPEIEYTFASGLRSILRQDPDVIMVGEIRDSETAELATHAALTGHIVLSTLHTNNAVGVIPRLVDMGVQNFLIPPALTIAISQRLIRRLCPDCKKPLAPSPKIKQVLEKELAALPEDIKQEFAEFLAPEKMRVWRAAGCNLCGKKGTKDRIAIHEALIMTPQLERIIIESPTETKIREEAKRQGMVTMRQDGFIKALQGMVSFEEVISAAEEESGAF